MKTILTVSAAAALVLGIGATGQAVRAQQQDSQWSASIGNAVTNAVLAEVQQEVANAATRIAATTSAAVAQKVDAKIHAKLARMQEKLEAAQERALIEAVEQAEAPRARVYISGDGDETGWLGVTPEDISADRAKELKLSTARGIYVSEVEEGSPAEKAGLKSGDVIIEFNGQHVEGVTQFRRLVRETPPGHNVAIVISRDGKSQTINATLSTMSDQFQHQFRVNVGNGMRDFTLNMPDMHNWEGPMVAPRPAMPAMPMTPSAPMPPGSYSYAFPEGGYGFGFGSGSGMVMGSTPSIGISGENLSGQLGTYFGAPDGEGVLVREVQSGSPAEKGGLKAGDVITKVAGERVRTISDLQYKLRDKRDEKSVQITVVRHGSETNVTVEPNKPRTIAPARGRGVA
jgi:C-terminal processing protease CtpA/Prc